MISGEKCGGRWIYNVGEDGFIMWGKIGEKVHVDRGGWGRKFLAHATLFLMVPKCQSTPLVVFIYIGDNT
jgi:hypothetical protein